MKKIFRTTYLALLLIAGLSCNNDPMPDAPNGKYPILFRCSDETRAEATVESMKSDTNGFDVYAYFETNTGAKVSFEKNVKWDDSKDMWLYDGIEYWVIGATYWFKAVYPKGIATVDNDDSSSIKLSVTETPSEIDFLIAENGPITSVEGYDTAVDLQFKHVLTSVGLNIWRDGGKHQNDQMRIKTVTLGNILKSGTYSTANTGAWSYNDDRLKVEKVYENFSDTDNIGAAVLNNGTLEKGGTPANPFGDMMLLPQTLDDSNVVSLKIVYELKRQNAADWEEAELEAVLPNKTLNPGQRYTFNVVLSSVTDITIYYIQTKVDPWGTPQVGGTVIIK